MTSPESPQYPPDARTLNMAELRQLMWLRNFDKFTFLGFERDPKTGFVELVEKKSRDLIMAIVDEKTDGLIVSGSAGEGKSVTLSALVEAANTISGKNYTWWFVLFDLLRSRLIKELGKETSEFTQADWDLIDQRARTEEASGVQQLGESQKQYRIGYEFPCVGVARPSASMIQKRRGLLYVKSKFDKPQEKRKLYVAVSASEKVREEAGKKRSVADSIRGVTPETLPDKLMLLQQNGIEIEQDLQELEVQGYEQVDMLQRLAVMFGASANSFFIDMLWRELQNDAEYTYNRLNHENPKFLRLRDAIVKHLRDKHPEVSGRRADPQRQQWAVVILHWLARMDSLGLDHHYGVVAVNSYSERLSQPGTALRVFKDLYRGS